MKSLTFYTKAGCPACTLMAQKWDEALKNVNIDIDVIFRHGTIGVTKTFIDDEVDRVPTTIIKNEKGNEITRLIGTFPTDYLIDVLKKL